jgi:hypothetical protein
MSAVEQAAGAATASEKAMVTVLTAVLKEVSELKEAAKNAEKASYFQEPSHKHKGREGQREDGQRGGGEGKEAQRRGGGSEGTETRRTRKQASRRTGDQASMRPSGVFY